jgi:serine/threonine protein kinase
VTAPTSDFPRHASALLPDFELQREIGRGGMGVVYLALDVRLDRLVAVKVLPERLAASPEVRERFLREARMAAKLSHPNIVPIYRADELAGVAFFVMGYVNGPSLAERLAARGALPALEIAPLLRDVAHALGYAHARGVVHRDVKPGNILIEPDPERALVTDFGIARLAETSPLTGTGQVLGTVHYMSPEQANGETLDGRSDLYSLGVVAFLAVTGRLPFDNASAIAVLVAHASKAAAKVRDLAPDVPEAMASVIDRCRAKDPSARYQTGAELADAIDQAMGEIVNDPAAPRADTPVISEREAQALWARAAQLQAETGVQPSGRGRAAQLPPPSVNDRRSLTSGYRLHTVIEAAEEAGIPQRYVARAAEEQGLVQAAASLGEVGSLTSRKFFGLPIGVGRTIDLDRKLSEDDWDRLVVDLRETFKARGTVRQDGSFRQWTNGNLQVLLEPTASGHRVRIHTVKADARAWMMGSLVTLGIAAVTTIAAVVGGPIHADLTVAAEMAVLAAGQFAIGAIRLPGWARLRRKQMEEISRRLKPGMTSLPSQDSRG